MKTLERNSKLINKKFIAYLIPSILMVFAMQFGSLIDGILIGNLLGSEALSAASLVSPFIYIAQIPGFALGIGGSIVVANLLGKREIEKAKKVFSFCMIVGLAFSLFFAALAPLISRPIACLFGPEFEELCYQYIFVYLLTDPLLTFALLIAPFISVDNSPKLSSAIYIVGNGAKIGFEILFISVFKMELYGAALSTGIGYITGCLLILFYIFSKKRILKFSFKIKGCGIKDIIKSSSSYAINMLLMAVQMLVICIVIGSLNIETYQVLAYGLMANMVFVFDLICGGILNLIPTLCSLFYGEKDVYSLKSVTIKLFWLNLIVTLLILLVIAITPTSYAIIFGFDVTDPKMAEINALLRLYVFSFIGYSINKFALNYYPSIDKNSVAIVTTICRELVIVLPVTLGLLYADGIEGYAIAAVITETVTSLIMAIYILIYNHKKKNIKGFFMIDKIDFVSYDVTVDNELENASVISEELTNFAKINKINEREAQVVGLAAEEMVNNIINYGYKTGRKAYIDVNLKVLDNLLILRIRDDGMPFDPTKYEFENDEKYSTSGIYLIKNMVDKMTYLRILNMNNTIFEINLKGEN